jgi:signal transduction histidine kinase
MLRNSLLYKVLLIVVIPFSFEIAIFSTLLGIQHAQQVEAQRIDKLRLISAGVNKITLQILQLQSAFENFENPAVAVMAVNKSFKDLFKSFEELARLTESDEQKHQIVMLSLSELLQTKADLDQLKAAVTASHFSHLEAIGRTFRPRFHAHLHNVIDTGFLQLATTTAAELDTDKTAATRENEINLLKIALLASSLLAVLSAAALSKYLIKKLKIIAQNAKRMSTREDLLPPVSGNDEISQVDLSMHAAATEIRHLEQAREEIMGMVSHDIRNPLGSIKFSVEAMKAASEDEFEYYLGSIDSNCDLVLSISKNLLDIQKLESGTLILTKEHAAIKSCILAAIEAVEGTRHSRNTKLEIVAPDKLSARIDTTKIEQVLINLIGNAIKFSPKNATVKIVAEPHENGVLVRVEDEGKGIPPALHKNVFDRFVQSDDDNYRAKGAIGLGLAICKGLIEMHGGWIAVQNAVPRGCQFMFWLPSR